MTFYSSHVQINNDSAIAFYKKSGFDIVDTKPAYYKRIEPADAHVLQKKLVKGGGKGNNNKSQVQQTQAVIG